MAMTFNKCLKKIKALEKCNNLFYFKSGITVFFYCPQTLISNQTAGRGCVCAVRCLLGFLIILISVFFMEKAICLLTEVRGIHVKKVFWVVLSIGYFL